MRGSPETSLRVLVVDDNEDTALSLAFLFRSWGHQVHLAHDGISAVEAARDFRPDAVILDIGLPRLDGFEVARQLRAMPELGRLFIVGASGYSGEKDRLRACEVGIDLYLVKPFDPWQMEKLLVVRSTAATVPV